MAEGRKVVVCDSRTFPAFRTQGLTGAKPLSGKEKKRLSTISHLLYYYCYLYIEALLNNPTSRSRPKRYSLAYDTPRGWRAELEFPASTLAGRERSFRDSSESTSGGWWSLRFFGLWRGCPALHDGYRATHEYQCLAGVATDCRWLTADEMAQKAELEEQLWGQFWNK